MRHDISNEVIDLPVPQMFASADKLVINWEGENYYKACGALVYNYLKNDPSGHASSHCVKPAVHGSVEHEDMDGRRSSDA